MLLSIHHLHLTAVQGVLFLFKQLTVVLFSVATPRRELSDLTTFTSTGSVYLLTACPLSLPCLLTGKSSKLQGTPL